MNEEHLATEALGDLVVPLAGPGRGLSLSQWAVLAMVLGASILALVPVALEFFGTDWKVRVRGGRRLAPSNRKEAALVR